MQSFINLMGDVVFTEAQIRHRLKDIERSVYSERDEQELGRIVDGIALGAWPADQESLVKVNNFKNFMEEMIVLGITVRAENDLLFRTISYEQAQIRLAQVIALDGRPEQIAVDATYDADGIELTPAIPYIAGVEPLPEFVEVEIGGALTTIRNPAVVQDEAERAAAQAVIDGAGVDVLELAGLRSA